MSTRLLRAVVGAAVVSSSAAAYPAVEWFPTSSLVEYLVVPAGDGPPSATWTHYQTLPVTLAGDPLVGNGYKFYGVGQDNEVFALTGATYIPTPNVDGAPAPRGNRFVIRGTGRIDGSVWQHPQDFIRSHFDFNLSFTAGQVDIYAIESGFEVRDINSAPIIGVGSSTSGGVFGGGSAAVVTTFEDRFGADITAGRLFVWELRVYFDWTGYETNDTLSFRIPQNSIDVQAVPAPGAAGVAAAIGAAGLRRRRR